MADYEINKPFWRSKKWIMTMIAVVVPVVNHVFGIGLSLEDVLAVVTPIVAYILAQGYVDANH